MPGLFVLNIIFLLTAQVHNCDFSGSNLISKTIISFNENGVNNNEYFVCNKSCFITDDAYSNKILCSDGFSHRYFVSGTSIAIYLKYNLNNQFCKECRSFETDASPPMNC